MSKKSIDAPTLKEACLHAAREVIAESGVENLSLRDVARKLGISHQAPYRHFASRDHLLAEIMGRCFIEFAQYLEQRPRSDDPHTDLGAMGHAYLDYAQSKPLEYRLMFGTPWPEPAQHPELLRNAVHAFNMLRDSLRRMSGNHARHHALADRQAMFIWSALHGMASITQANVMQHLSLSAGVQDDLRTDLLERIRLGLLGTKPPAPPKKLASKRPQKPRKLRP